MATDESTQVLRLADSAKEVGRFPLHDTEGFLVLHEADGWVIVSEEATDGFRKWVTCYADWRDIARIIHDDKLGDD